MNPIIRKILKVLAWIVGSIIFLVILLLILIQIPAVQNFAKNKAVAYLEKKLKTKVVIDRLAIAFPKQVVLKGVYFEDQKKDTLLYGKEIRVDIALFKLIKSEVNVNYLELNGIKAHVYRVQPDTAFNFDYIIKAFASPDTTTAPRDTTGGMKFTLDRIVFKDILTTFKDDESGSDIYFYLGNFETKVKTFDPDKLVYDVSKISIAGIDARIHQYSPTFIQKVDSTVKTANVKVATEEPNIKLGELTLNDIKFSYQDDVAAMQANIKIGDLITHPKSINTQTLDIRLSDLILKNTVAAVALSTPPKPVKPVIIDSALPSLKWNVVADKLVLDNEDLSYNDNTQPRAKKGMDFSHLHIQGLQFDANDLLLTPAAYKGSIKQLAFKEQSGFSLQKFQTNFYYSDTAAYLQDLYVEAGRTVLRDKVVVKYPSVKTISSHIGDLYVDADLKNAAIDAKDILTFAPQLEGNLRGNDRALLHVNAGVHGYVKDLSIPVFQVGGVGNTYINISGKIKGLPDAAKAYYDINIAQLKTTASDIYTFVPRSSLPSNIRIPSSLSAKGYFKGNTKNLATQLQLNTSNGNAFVKGNMRNNGYTADVTLSNFNVGYIIKQDSVIGTVNLTAKAKGNGFDLKTAVADVAANVKSAQLKGYTYKNLVLKANAGNGMADVNANMQDENLKFDLKANANVSTAFPSDVKMQLQLDTINFRQLHLMSDTLAMHGTLTADLPSANPDSLVGNISLAGFAVTQGTRTLNPDSLFITAAANGQQRSLNITSPFLHADLTGVYRFSEMGQALGQTINQYYNISGFEDKAFVAEDWQLNASFIPSPFILQVVSGVKGTDSIAMHADFNSANHSLNAAVKTKRFMFNGTQADSVNVTAATAGDKLNFNASVAGARTSSISIYHTAVSGFVANNKVDVALDMDDAKNKTRYAVAGTLEQITQGIKFSLHPEGLVLNYDKWNAGADNYIQYDSTGLIINNFAISNANQLLSVNSEPKSADAPLQVKFSNFQIATIARLANQDTLLVGGAINGNATVKNATTNPVFTADLTIDSVMYKKDTLGTVTVKVNNQTANAFAADVTVKGNGNDVRLNGMYYTGESRMDLKLAVNSLNLATIKPFAAGQLTDAGGTAKADINIAGTVDKPAVNGSLNFVDAYIIPTISGERFNLSNQAINVDGQGIHLNNFTLLDSAGNRATLAGDILTTDFKKFRFNASLDARNFTAVNAPKAPKRLFYGMLNINVHAKLNGDMDAPQADATLRINAATNFTMIIPSNDPEVQEREGIVKFVDKDHPDTTITLKTFYDSLATSTLRGIDVNANIETDSAARLSLVIDESTGDALTMQGVANLNGGIDKSGKVSLTGAYQLTHGSYTVSLSVLKRQFEIQPGSSITWTGDPKLAQVDINAVYYAKTAPIDLVQQQLGSNQDLTRFKQKLPFQVNLKLQGDLLKPAVTFDISIPQNLLSTYPEVDLKLQQIRTDASELNKQVFALLLLNRFVQEDPFASGAGSTSVAQLGLQSAGRILGEQLNNLAASLIKGVDINFDINSDQDYTTGQQQTRTDINVTVSKKLLNDRLIVNVGSDVGLQGAANNATSVQNSSISGNFSVDYKLSRDGKYRLRAYRQNDYQEIIEGQVIETGLSFILTVDFDKLSELFHNKKRRRSQAQSVPAKVETDTKGQKVKTNDNPDNDKKPTPVQGNNN